MWAPENRQIGGVFFAFFLTVSEQRKHSKFGALEAQKPWYLRCLFCKVTVFTVFFGLGVAKHWYLRSFQLVARRMCFMPKAQKDHKLPWFLALGKQQQTQQMFAKKCPNPTSETHLGILASFFPARGPQKRLNTTSLTIFLGGSTAGASPG